MDEQCKNCGSRCLDTVWFESDEFGPFDPQPMQKCRACGHIQTPAPAALGEEQ